LAALPRSTDRPSRCLQPRRGGLAGRPPMPDLLACADPLPPGDRHGAKSPPLWAGPSKARMKDRGWTAPRVLPARSSAHSRNTAALPRAGRVDRALRLGPRGFANRGLRGCGRGSAHRMPAGNCRCPPARAHSRQAAPCCRDERCWPARSPQPPVTAARHLAALCRIAALSPGRWGWCGTARARFRRRAWLRRLALCWPSHPATP
jgi:hypothetical protein